MFSASGEVLERVWKKIVVNDKSVFLIPVNEEEPGAHVWWCDPTSKNSEGCAGRTIPFRLEDGTDFMAQGPWHTNTDSLFKATGVDLRDKHLTFVVLGKNRTMDKNMRTVIEDVVYIDEKPTLGHYDRYKTLITQHPEATHYYMESHGGSCSGPV